MWRLLLAEVVVVILVAVVWLVGPMVGLQSVLGRLGVILVLLLPPLAMLIWKMIKKRRDAKGLESALKGQGQAQAQQVRPDRRAEVEQLNERFEEAINALRRSGRGGKSGAAALYALPWYALIGPPGAGKSTSLARSGLNFPFTSEGAVKGVGGTRNCDWWFAEEAILLDTAGRYSIEDEDREEWLAFLGLLKRYRRKRPLNGLVVCVSIAELISVAPPQLEATAARIRQRIDELLEELELVVPVYLLLTKCDLLAGFVESFAQLKASSREQVLGFTIPLTDERTDFAALFDREFAALVGSLRSRAQGKLASAKPELRPGLFQFPMQLAATGESLKAFISRLFAPNPYGETPRLRGVYFGSGTQEGRPVDRVMAALSQSLGLRPAAQLEPQGQKKSYFLGHLFTRVIFGDRDLACVSRRGRRRRFRLSLVTTALSIAAAAVIAGFAVTSYSNNSGLVSSSVALASKRLTRGDEPEAVRGDLQALADLAARFELLIEHKKEGAPLFHRFGYYSGEPLIEPLTRLFIRRVKDVFVLPSGGELEKTIEDMSTASASSQEDDSAVTKDYELLKTYLMLDTPKHLDVDFAAARLVEQWKKRLDPRLHKETELLLTVARPYLRLVKAKKARWLPSDESLIAGARRALQVRDVGYRMLVADAKGALAPLSLRDLLQGRVQNALKGGATVPGLYSRKGWKLYMSKRLGDKAKVSVDPWVLGETDSGADLGARLRTRYFEQYIAKWEGFLRGLELAPVGTAKEALQQLEVLTDAPPLYQTLLSNIVYQTRFAEEGGASKALEAASKLIKGKAAKAVKAGASAGSRQGGGGDGNPVEQAFAPLHELVDPPPGPGGKPVVPGLKQYLDQLTALRDELAKFVANSEKPDTAGLNAVLADANRVTKGILAPLPTRLRSKITPLFYRPLQQAAQQAGAASASREADAFTTQVCEAFKDTLAGRYPFAAARRDALLQDASDFFAPSGTVWSYFSASLRDRLVRKGDRFEVKPEFKVPAQVVTFYERAWRITRALFPRGGEKPQLRFEIQPRPATAAPGTGYAVSEISLELGESKRVYRNGPLETWTYSWPPSSGDVRVTIRGSGGLREEIGEKGDWGLLRLIDRGKVRQRGAWHEVAWALRGGKITVRLDFRPSRSQSPLFTSLRLPSCP